MASRLRDTRGSSAAAASRSSSSIWTMFSRCKSRRARVRAAAPWPRTARRTSTRARAQEARSVPRRDTLERRGFRLGDDELHERGRVQVYHRVYRSRDRARVRATLGRGLPVTGLIGAPRSSRSPVGGNTRPRRTRRSTCPVPRKGTSSATARPLAVISYVRPASTSRRHSLARCRSSRTPMDFMVLHCST